MRERCRFCKCGRAASSFGYDRRRPLKLAIELATHRKTSTTSAPIIAKVNIVPPPILTKGRAGWMPGACCLYVVYFQLDIKSTASEGVAGNRHMSAASNTERRGTF